jgi:hypothetical protein
LANIWVSKGRPDERGAALGAAGKSDIEKLVAWFGCVVGVSIIYSSTKVLIVVLIIII